MQGMIDTQDLGFLSCLAPNPKGKQQTHIPDSALVVFARTLVAFCHMSCLCKHVTGDMTHGCKASDLHFWCLLGFGDIVANVDIVPKLNADPDDIQAHLDDMLACGAVVSGAHVALECVLQEDTCCG